MKMLIFLALAHLICISNSFMVGVDFNTFSSAELDEAIKYFGRVDFTWGITVNSENVTASQWNKAFASTNNQTVFS